MHYLGGKSKIRKPISEFLISKRSPGQIYWEPFVGGASILQELSDVRYASDVNLPLITMYRCLQRGWIPPTVVSEDMYYSVKAKNDPYDPLTAFCGFGCSFAGKWWGGYARYKDDNYALFAHNSLLKQLPKIQTVNFFCTDYKQEHPSGMLIYCDPPYINTTKYSGTDSFDHELFWDRMRLWSQDNTVIISERIAPEDFMCVKEIPMKQNMHVDGKNPVKIEKLFMYKGGQN